jgi:hypothetical protein
MSTLIASTVCPISRSASPRNSCTAPASLAIWRARSSTAPTKATRSALFSGALANASAALATRETWLARPRFASPGAPNSVSWARS